MARRLSGALSSRWHRRWRLTLFGRSLLLLTAELLANAVCWIVCAILFGRRPATRPILSLALLAWVSAPSSEAIAVAGRRLLTEEFNIYRPLPCPYPETCVVARRDRPSASDTVRKKAELRVFALSVAATSRSCQDILAMPYMLTTVESA